MIRKDLLKTIIADNQERQLPECWPRELEVPLATNKIVVLSGVRRSGKTYHLWQLIKKLQAEGVDKRRIIYLNFEDERLELTAAELALIPEVVRELEPEVDLAECFFFFDELQEVPGWEKFIARLYESDCKHIFITGSNAKLLSSEIATALRGRSITFEVFPLSFREYRQIRAPRVNDATTVGMTKLRQLFGQFMTEGGFPEVISLPHELKAKVLQEYFNVMLFRDLVERYQITQTAILKYFCKRVIGASGGELSVNKIFRELKSQGYQIGKDTLYSFSGYAEAIYLNRLVPKYAPSVVKTELASKKTYVIDQGLGATLDYKFSQDQGRILETVVALELYKLGWQIAYNQEQGECDFVVLQKGKVVAAIQVASDLEEAETKKREVDGLCQTCQRFGLSQGVIITMTEDDNFIAAGVNILVIPGWKFFSKREVSEKILAIKSD